MKNVNISQLGGGGVMEIEVRLIDRLEIEDQNCNVIFYLQKMTLSELMSFTSTTFLPGENLMIIWVELRNVEEL